MPGFAAALTGAEFLKKAFLRTGRELVAEAASIFYLT
jgi:hypothetical protein